MIKCHYHPEEEAGWTDSIVDINGPSTPGNPSYKRVPLCLLCFFYAREENTSRLEELEGNPWAESEFSLHKPNLESKEVTNNVI